MKIYKKKDDGTLFIIPADEKKIITITDIDGEPKTQIWNTDKNSIKMVKEEINVKCQETDVYHLADKELRALAEAARNDPDKYRDYIAFKLVEEKQKEAEQSNNNNNPNSKKNNNRDDGEKEKKNSKTSKATRREVEILDPSDNGSVTSHETITIFIDQDGNYFTEHNAAFSKSIEEDRLDLQNDLNNSEHREDKSVKDGLPTNPEDLLAKGEGYSDIDALIDGISPAIDQKRYEEQQKLYETEDKPFSLSDAKLNSASERVCTERQYTEEEMEEFDDAINRRVPS